MPRRNHNTKRKKQNTTNLTDNWKTRSIMDRIGLIILGLTTSHRPFRDFSWASAWLCIIKTHSDIHPLITGEEEEREGERSCDSLDFVWPDWKHFSGEITSFWSSCTAEGFDWIIPRNFTNKPNILCQHKQSIHIHRKRLSALFNHDHMTQWPK